MYESTFAAPDVESAHVAPFKQGTELHSLISRSHLARQELQVMGQYVATVLPLSPYGLRSLLQPTPDMSLAEVQVICADFITVLSVALSSLHLLENPAAHTQEYEET
jgi:hypothetical protein